MCQDRNLSQPHSVQISHLPSSPGLLNFLGKVSRQVRGRGFKADGDILGAGQGGSGMLSHESCPFYYWGRRVGAGRLFAKFLLGQNLSSVHVALCFPERALPGMRASLLALCFSSLISFSSCLSLYPGPPLIKTWKSAGLPHKCC